MEHPALILWTIFSSPKTWSSITVHDLVNLSSPRFPPYHAVPSTPYPSTWTQNVTQAEADPRLAITNGASLIGRIVPLIAAQRFGAINTLIAFGASSGIMLFIWTKAKGTGGIVAYGAVYGITSGEPFSSSNLCALSWSGVGHVLSSNEPTCYCLVMCLRFAAERGLRST